MARKTVRVAIPTSKPEQFLKLCKDATAKHKSLGAASPLKAEKMDLLDLLINGKPAAGTDPAVEGADTKNTNAKEFDAKAQSERQKRDILLGLAEGQSSATKGAALNLITYVRDELLIDSDGNDEALGEWGFDVVVGTAKSPTKKPAQP